MGVNFGLKVCALFCVDLGLLCRPEEAPEAPSPRSPQASDDAANGSAVSAASYASGQNDFLEQVIYIVRSSFA